MVAISPGQQGELRHQRKSLLDAEIGACRRCEGLNVPHVTASAPGYGSLYSPVAMVGQSLCEQCMETGIPFTKGSGELIDDSLARAARKKDAIFISNVVHCHPPRNRPSHDYEIVNCSAYLHRELDIVRPRLVIALGADAERALTFFYPGGRTLSWPFSVPRGRSSKRTPYLFFAKHPSWVKRQHDEAREAEYVSSLAAAISWSFENAARDAGPVGSPE